MSSSSNPNNGQFIQQFTYPVLDLRLTPSPGGGEAPPAPSVPMVPEEQANVREAAAYRRGLAEGQQLGRTETAGLIEQAKTALANALTEFGRERETYFQEIEAEVVSLALSVARKILNREAQVDPLVLQGVVRAALERLSTGSTVRLCAPPAHAEAWRRLLAAHPPHLPVEVVEDAALNGQQCRIETELGSSHLKVETQLKEIEQGFADLLARAPRSGA